MIPPPVLKKTVCLPSSNNFSILNEISPLDGGPQKERRGKEVVG